jgi:N-acetylglucosamine transport system substrate-binding protein
MDAPRQGNAVHVGEPGNSPSTVHSTKEHVNKDMNKDHPAQTSTNRRSFLRGAAAVGVGATLAPYLGRAGIVSASTVPAGGDASNPFGIAPDSTVDAVIFNGGYGIDYVEFAADIFEQTHEGSSVEVSPSTQIAQELQPRFVGGNPPDLIDNSGAQSIGFQTILAQLEDLTDVIDAPNLEGVTIRDTLYGGVLAPGTFDGKLAAINYALTVYGVWYSSSLFDENGWTPPTTWEEALELGALAKEQDKYLFCWGQEAATYYQTLSIDSAIKEGGHEVRLALENLEEGCWSHPAVQAVFTALKQVVDNEYMLPGGAGTQFTAAQAQWSLDQAAILYPSGSWIENEMKAQTAEGFAMRGVPSFTVTADSAMPATALHSTAGEPFIVPTQGANVAGGKELLRIMLSTEAATNFARTKLAPTVVAGLVPEDGFGSTALVSQTDMLAAAGEEIFTHNFVDFYGTNQEQLVIWNSFLSGDSSVEDLTSSLQDITDRIREDDSITKIVVE